MKKIVLLSLLCLSLTSFAFSQGKPEFGFVLKVGNYAIPGVKHNTETYSTYNKTFYKSGSVYTLGIWQSLRLGSHFYLSGELLYRNAVSVVNNHFFNQNFEGYYRSDETQKTTENSLSLPIKLHFSFKKDGKFAVAFGAGLTRYLSANVYTRTNSQSFPFPETTGISVSKFSNWGDFHHKYNLNAGFYYRLNSKTSLGLEYTFEKAAAPNYPNTFFPRDPLVDCDCFFTSAYFNHEMNSFSVSLRHNILD